MATDEHSAPSSESALHITYSRASVALPPTILDVSTCAYSTSAAQCVVLSQVDLKDIITPQTWSTVLSSDERTRLAALLPQGTDPADVVR